MSAHDRSGWAVFGIGDFRLFGSARFLTGLAYQMQAVAIGWFVYDLTHSALALGLVDAEPSAEDGRGIQLMRALVDEVTFTSRPQVGTVVHLEKQLSWSEGSVLQRLSADAPATEHGPWSEDERFEDRPEPV